MTDRVGIPVFAQQELDAIYRLRAGTHVLVEVVVFERLQSIYDQYVKAAAQEGE